MSPRLALLLALALVLSGPARAKDVEPDSEAHLLALINGERHRNSLPSLVRIPILDAAALANSRLMADRRRVQHSPPSRLKAVRIAWTAIGENVGSADDVAEVHRLMMRSAGHRGNLLRPAFDAVGLAVVRGDDDRVYVTEVFIGRGPAPAQ